MPYGENKYLYMQLQNGLQEYSVENDAEYTFNFEERDIPNINLYGVYFTGSSYIESSTGWYEESVSYDTSERALKIKVDTDKDRYEPGEEVDLSVSVTDVNDNPVQAEVNLNTPTL